ncbi:MAG TPA: response regulator [Candidatus Thermoplasmatota archaeon]|nr:response regulator [Candidatus Thermoplasmatota archaeon]
MAAKAGFNILWAEDDRQDQQLIQAALEDNKPAPRIAFAEDGVALLETVGRHPPDLVVLDLKMPRMGGLEALRRLRTEPATRNLPVIIFSSGSLPDEVAQCQELGVLDTVQKPIEFGAFVSAVQGIVRLALLPRRK